MSQTMDFDDASAAIEDAKNTIRRADTVTKELAYILCGRLRAANVSNYILTKLKRELRDFNIHLGAWKD